MGNQTSASPAVAGLAALMGELRAVMERHNATGIALTFMPGEVTLPADYVLVQRFNASTGTIELVPTRIEDCTAGDVLAETVVFDLGDGQFIQFAHQPGRTHGCTVSGGCHTHSPR